MSATPAEIARRALADHLAALPSDQLLTRYARTRDPEAFAGLVHQFGPLVLGTCRRVLGQSHDADDAFQAVFLALSRQAQSFRDAKALPAWLHRVSLRVSRKALARREPTEATPEPTDPADPFADVAWKDVRRVLDEELDQLPEKLRGPVLLCWLDGLTQDEAAGKLGVSLNTLKRRLDDGRELLRSRLLRRGLTPVLVTAVVSSPTGLRAVVPETLRLLAVELGVGGDLPTGVAALEIVLPATEPARKSLKVALALVLVGGVATAGVVAMSDNPPPPPEIQTQIPTEPTPDPTGDGPELAPAPRPFVRPMTIPRNRMVPSSEGVLWWSPDGKTIAALASDDEGRWIKFWDVTTGEERSRLGPLPNLLALKFSPDGKRVATYGSDNTYSTKNSKIEIWDVATGKKTASCADTGENVYRFAWSEDGRTLASLGYRVSFRGEN